MHWIVAVVLAFLSTPASTQEPSPFAIDIPPWFAQSFLDFREEVEEAARGGRRVLVYFGQDGCPYCKQLIVSNFSQRNIVAKTRTNFVAIALNMWGDREVTWLDGRVTTEKELARVLKVQFTPTLLFLDEQGKVVVRLNGYYPPQRFEAVLDYVAGHLEGKEPVDRYLQRHAREPASPVLHEAPFLLGAPYDLRRNAGSKPLAVLFETTHCSPCDELHRDAFRRAEIRSSLQSFDVVRFSLGAPTQLITPAGRSTTAQAWARELGISYTPTIVFFDGIEEVFRIESYLRPFHIASSLDYVASQAYRTEPSFQRYLQARAERMRARGQSVELWR